jgi:DNA repair protein RAD50
VKLKGLRKDKERIQGQVTQFENEAHEIQSKLSTTIYKLQEKAAVAAQIDDLRTQIQEQKDVTQKAEKGIELLAPKIRESQVKLDDTNRRREERISQFDMDLSKLNESVQALNAQSRSIDSYLDRGGEDQLHRSERTLEALREEYSGVDIDKQEIARGVQELRKSRDNHNNVRRTMQDNLNYRNDKKQLKEFEAAIRELESHDAEKDYRTWNNESTAQQNVRNTLNAEQATLVGIIKSKDDQLKGLIQDWNTDFKDAAYKYREAHVKVEATKAVVEDLGRYGGALDKAIMKYHSMKMEEINRIIEELWKRTYQGTDVDTVSIRSDNETGKGNKSYNYRVCMVKQDVEMDMRGRCSAGQKVLACIIIRLALAECFGVACGLIALDEPTTNLDRENIKALAISLHGIIKERRRQSNFQLIIITHDEEFLRNMQCSDFCERYYRVSRDVRQKSIIERQDISLVSSRSCKMWRRLLILCRSWSKRCDTDDDMVYEIRERKILGDSAGERFVLLAYNDEADRIVGWLFPGIQ